MVVTKLTGRCLAGQQGAARLMASGCLALVLALPHAGWAQGGGGSSAVDPDLYDFSRFAFDAADTDGDEGISLPELARDTAAGFAGLDADASGTLTPDELDDHDPTLFEAVDTDGDGALSFTEVMVNKEAGFAAADRDGDGRMSYDEMIDAIDTELAK